MRVSYSPRAELDFLEIADFVSDRSIPAAFDVIARIEAAVLRLGDMPRIGRERDDLGRPDFRSISVGDWVVVYRVQSDNVRITRIIHGARNLRAILEREPRDYD